MHRDRTFDLLREGYPWGARLRRGRSAVPTRLLGRRAVVVGGAEGVRRFYDPRLRRRGSFPLPLKLVLFGPGTVHGLDDAEHHLRKALFLSVITPEAVVELGERADREWRAAIGRWRGRDRPSSPPCWTASRAPGYLRAVRARWRVGRWARGLIRGTRRGELRPPEGSALHAAAQARDGKDRLLRPRVAATTLLNVVRPTIAVAWFVAFAGRALHEHPEWRTRIADGDRAALAAFAQEVRRLYPFVPVLAARARRRQDVLGVGLRRGGLVVLDVHGTDHEPAHWPAPDRFDPGRFLRGPVDPDTLVPQGGGDVALGHRCPGEGVTLTMLEVAVRALADAAFTVPAQDLGYDLAGIPSRPRSGVVLQPALAAEQGVQPAGQHHDQR